jgi:predicted HTH domain antitoxin
MAKAQKTLSIRMDADDYSTLSRLAEEEGSDLSSAARDLLTRGRVMLAIERYAEGSVSLGRAAELAGLAISRFMDVLAQHGVPANLDEDDYLESLSLVRQVW